MRLPLCYNRTMSYIRFGIIGVIIFIFSGCSIVRVPKEVLKTFWGSTTRALEEARVDAKSTIFQCAYEECFDVALDAAQKSYYEIFINDKKQQHIVVMGIKGNVNTTEVGIFFVRLSEQKIRIEVSSLSSSAKEKVADVIFSKLKEIYSEIH